MTTFLREKVKYGFHENWMITEKDCSFISKVTKEELQGLTEDSFSTALSFRYLNYFVIVPRD